MSRLWLTKKKELIETAEMITIEVKKLAIAKMAIEKAEGMIAHAIAKSEIVVKRKEGRVKDEIYWMLNIKPNVNETATEFWEKVVKKILKEQECVICKIGTEMYVAETWDTDRKVMKDREYRNITIEVGGERFALQNAYKGSNIIHMRCENKKIRGYLEKTLKEYNKIVDSMTAAKKVMSTPKFMLNIPGVMPIIKQRDENGNEREITLTEYKKSIKKMLESDDIEILQTSSGMLLEELKIESKVTSEDIAKLTREMMEECAFAYDIPKSVFLGEITEKADSTNEFITYAVSWVKEIIEDALNGELVGKKDYIAGERIWINMTKFKHRDIVESAGNLDKLRAIGFTLDEIMWIMDWDEVGSEEAKKRALTKNYEEKMGGVENEKKA